NTCRRVLRRRLLLAENGPGRPTCWDREFADGIFHYTPGLFQDGCHRLFPVQRGRASWPQWKQYFSVYPKKTMYACKASQWMAFDPLQAEPYFLTHDRGVLPLRHPEARNRSCAGNGNRLQLLHLQTLRRVVGLLFTEGNSLYSRRRGDSNLYVGR